MSEPSLNLDEILAAIQPFAIGTVPLQPIASENKQRLAELSSFDPLRLASTFSGLLTAPELQSNCIRLEILVHLALAFGRGRRKPNNTIVTRLFCELGKGITGRQEDPAEDVFVSSIATPRGNFRILEGVWESAGFYVQRVVNALELIPAGACYDHMRECVYALLRLSDVICERAGLVRHQLGNAVPEQALPGKLAKSSGSLRRLVKFTESDLTAYGISVEHLAEFGFDPAARAGLAEEMIGHSTLERYPIAHRNGEFFFVLPTAASPAIRRYAIEKMEELGLRETFAGTLAFEYARLFSDTPLLGQHSGAPIEFRRTDDCLLAGVTTRADRGLYVNFVFFVDTLEGFEKAGLVGMFPDHEPTKLAANVDRWIDEAYLAARKEVDFREGLTLLVGCGIGRAIVDFTSDKKRDNWRLEFVGASDLLTLSWLPKFKALSLWRLLESQDRLQQLGVELHNINGLLNMVGWVRSLGGHLVPHGALPDDFGKGEVPNFIMIEQNALRGVRHEVVTHWDPHVVQGNDGKWVRVRKDGGSFFKEDRELPFFIAEERCGSRWPRGVYETASRAWWYELETPQGTEGYWAYERSKMLMTWLCRTALVLEMTLPDLPTGAVLWRTKFEGPIGDREGSRKRERLTFDDARAAISVEVDAEKSTVTLIASARFEEAIFHPENIAERALVAGAVEGFARLGGENLSSEDREALVQAIAGDVSARQMHAFMARQFRDFVQGSVWRTPITIDVDDAAILKLGLGWRARDRAMGGDIRGKDECTSFLNAIVRLLEDEVCEDLQGMNRRSVLLFALINHESAICNRDTWRRTAAAVLALHNDKEAALQTIARHEFELNAVFQASRLLIEFALCECRVIGSRKPGRLDMSRIMAKLMMISGMGGWSDAIRWDAMEPRVRVTPLGDIHANVTFHDKVIAPYGRLGIDLTVRESVERYAENLQEPEVRPADGSAFAPEFWEAFEEEFGASIDDVRKFVDYVEGLGLKAKRAILSVKRSKLLQATFEDERIPPDRVKALVEFLTFKGRPRWRDVPAGYDEKDRFPWRFRRRLSALRKPLIQLDDADDPTILVAPGMLRDSLVYTLSNYHQGDFPLWQLKPKMKQWAGKSRKRMGREFSQSVAKRLEELGWRTETEVAVTKLLRKGFDQNYGDVDVLAWRADTGRVLIIECKDVQHRKTDGEIAEQIADFRGELAADGKPDLLLRHLNRVDVISRHQAEVMTYVGFDHPPQIEGHLVFRNLVPMKFAWDRMNDRVSLSLMSELDRV